MTTGTVVSMARYAPLGDMALHFDGQNAIATAPLPADLLAQATGAAPLSVTFWLNVPVPAPDIEPAPAPQAVLDVRGPSGPLAAWTVGADGTLRVSLPSSPPEDAGVPLQPFAGQWVFVTTTYGPPDDTHPHGQVQLTVRDGGPTPVNSPVDLLVTPNPQHEDRVLTVGHPAVGSSDNLLPLHGLITRIRLWSSALTSAQAGAAMYDYPVGPRAPLPGPLLADWRISEGYGDTAFDYASPAPDHLPVRYAPPPGNHLRLGGDGAGAVPVWTVADLTTLVPKTATNATLL